MFVYSCLRECDIGTVQYVHIEIELYYNNNILDAYTADVCISISDVGDQNFGDHSTNTKKRNRAR